ncbi:MAG: ATP-binding cassette domain-containing protein [Bacteroidota bacterium]
MLNIIHLENVNIYQSGNVILSNVNIDVDKGEFVYLIGKTGTGKSSLLKTLYAELKIQEGKGAIAGYDLNNLKRKEIPFLRRKLGIVFQDFQLLTDRNVYQNLQFVLKATGWKDKKEIDARIMEVFGMVGMQGKIAKMPHELSGGEQQKVAIARSLLNHPEIILADEPTGNLDPEISDDIMKLLFDISKTGCAVLMATHNYQLIEKYPSRILKCENNRITDSKQPMVNEIVDTAVDTPIVDVLQPKGSEEDPVSFD